MINDKIHEYKKFDVFIAKIDAIIENVDEFIDYFYLFRYSINRCHEIIFQCTNLNCENDIRIICCKKISLKKRFDQKNCHDVSFKEIRISKL